MDSSKDSDLACFLGDLSQSEKLSEIKPPLLIWYVNVDDTVKNYLLFSALAAICNTIHICIMYKVVGIVYICMYVIGSTIRETSSIRTTK